MRFDALYITVQLPGFHPVFPTFSPSRNITRVSPYRADYISNPHGTLLRACRWRASHLGINTMLVSTDQ